VELEGFRQCHIRDGAALIRYFSWLEEELETDKELSEYDAALQLEKYRS
jgi:Xaa-Pro aminopeptidase